MLCTCFKNVAFVKKKYCNAPKKFYRDWIAEQGRDNILKLHLYNHQLQGENGTHFPMRHIERV